LPLTRRCPEKKASRAGHFLRFYGVVKRRAEKKITRLLHTDALLLAVTDREPSVSGVAQPPGPALAQPVQESSSVDTEDEPETDDTGSTIGKAPSPLNPLLQERSNCEELRHVVCHLETKDLWDKFNELGTEMIITKTGRSARFLLSLTLTVDFPLPLLAIVHPYKI
jgi:hypothetical protein